MLHHSRHAASNITAAEYKDQNGFVDEPCFLPPCYHSLLFAPHIPFIGEIYIKKEYKQKENLGRFDKKKKSHSV